MIDKTFAFHQPSAASLEAITNVRRAYTQLFHTVRAFCPRSREQSVALTELETSAMWAIKSIVANDSESVAHTEDN